VKTRRTGYEIRNPHRGRSSGLEVAAGSQCRPPFPGRRGASDRPALTKAVPEWYTISRNQQVLNYGAHQSIVNNRTCSTTTAPLCR
jgi:hypothetical protein